MILGTMQITILSFLADFNRISFFHSNFQRENSVLEELSSENPKECDHGRTGERFET